MLQQSTLCCYDITDGKCSNVKTKGIWEDFETYNLLPHIMGKTKTELSFGDSLDR